jgi:hypothetical protein
MHGGRDRRREARRAELAIQFGEFSRDSVKLPRHRVAFCGKPGENGTWFGHAGNVAARRVKSDE